MGNRLAGKFAVITGGTRNIGAATARLFVREGASVVIAELLEKEGNLKFAGRIKEMMISAGWGPHSGGWGRRPGTEPRISPRKAIWHEF